jgi:SAM-dependent methyltransferase
VTPSTDWTTRDVMAQGVLVQPVTRRLLERLLPEDVDAVRASLHGESAALWERAGPEERNYLVLALGVHAELPGVLERTGLVPDEAPAEVHAMARGPLAAGGDYYSADLVLEALEAAGGDIAQVGRALDFGCSSGRTLRPLVAAYPDVDWHGVDPNRAAVAWATRHIAGATFHTSSNDPPLPFPNAHFDLAYAISIWSHFGERAARAWLDEMRRIVAPGGHLVITVHGLQSMAFYGAQELRPPEQLDEIAKALYRDGFWFADEFGEAGDFGVRHPEWGTAFMTPEWLLRVATPAWHVASYAVGRNAGNQDVFVLRRPPGDPVLR